MKYVFLSIIQCKSPIMISAIFCFKVTLINIVRILTNALFQPNPDVLVSKIKEHKYQNSLIANKDLELLLISEVYFKTLSLRSHQSCKANSCQCNQCRVAKIDNFLKNFHNFAQAARKWCYYIQYGFKGAEFICILYLDMTQEVTGHGA